MVYLFLVVFVLFCVYEYDFRKTKNNKSEAFLYIMLICICISAFKYRVGSDILIYIKEYKEYLPLGDLTFENVFGNSNRQPGWIILNAVFKSLSLDFVFFQIIQATFVNFTIFFFIKRNTKYIFTSVFFYLIYMYTELNFEVMRESFAISLFLLGLEAFKEKKWCRYYLFAFGAILFHLSSSFLFILPLFCFLPVNKIVLWFYYFLLVIVLLFFLPFLKDLFAGITLWGSMEEKATSYLTDSRYDINLTMMSIVKSLVLFSVTYYVTILYDYRNKQRWMIQLIILYFLFDILNKGIPFFYRFNNYLTIIYILLLTDSIYSILNYRFFYRCKSAFLLVLLVFFSYNPIRAYFVISEYSQTPAYRKYYPYYSIFMPEVDSEREKVFN